MSAKRRKFKTEVQQLLNLVIHSLYTHKEIFLRELISNASDAVDRARFESLSDKSLLEDDPDWKVKIAPDTEARTLTISDNGIGMSAEEIEKNIGTIASSGTRFFLDQLEKTDGKVPPELIGQFGVGFYSAFMVADEVTVVTRRGGKDQAATRWHSSGAGSYTLETVDKPTRGTDVILHLAEGMDEYLEEWRLRKIVKQYSDFVEHPVVMDITRQEGGNQDGEEATTAVTEETLNSMKAIWSRPKDDVTAEEHNEFYKHVSHDFVDPLKVLHWSVEGTTEFRALLYLPAKAPFDLHTPDTRHRGIHLYVKRIFITDNCEALIPPYLRFLRGVVDSSDLPLNVSRETLQEERVIRIIRKNLVKKVLDTLKEMLDQDRDAYKTFWGEFGRVIKEGMHVDFENREKLQDLLLFDSTKSESGEPTTLKDYVERMGEDQKAIYVITGENREALVNSPLLEAFRKRDIEVLMLTDPIDEWVVQALTTYADKPVKSVAKGEIDLEDAEEVKEEKEKVEKKYEALVKFLEDALKDKVKNIRISRRLTDSACCLVADEHDMGVQMEKILKAMHHDIPQSKRILEVNPDHALLQSMNNLVIDSKNHLKLTECATMLYDQALLTAGLPVEDPVRFAQRVSDMMTEGLAQ